MTESTVRRKDGSTRAEIEAAVRNALARTLRIAEADVRAESNLETELGLDSMGTINVNIALEERFGIALPALDESVENIHTVRQLVDFVAQELERQSVRELPAC